MHKAVAVFGLLLVLAGSAGSTQEELDIELMQTIEDTNKRLASNIALKQGDRAALDAQELAALFAKVEQYFAGRGEAATEAVSLARKSRELSHQVVQSVGRNDFAAATDAATALSRSCRTCHTFYKKQ